MTQAKNFKIRARQARLARYKDGTPVIRLEFPYDPDDILTVKMIPGRKWHAEYKLWTCPPTNKALKILQDAKFLIDPKLKEFLKAAKPRKSVEIPGLRKTLFPYQKEGVAFLMENGGRGLIGDDMGLGKTIQAIGYLQLYPKLRPAIVVCPSSVKLNWAREVKSWMGMGENQVEVIQGKTPYILSGDILIINYDILHSWIEVLIKMKPQVLILDECQYIKNNKAIRTTSVKTLSKAIHRVIALSGTPIINRPIEFFNVLRILRPDMFSNWLQYTTRYCNRRHNGFGWDVSGASNTEELHELINGSVMIRRLKQEVLPELPDKIRSFFPLEMHPELLAEYEEAEANFLEWMRTRRGKKAADRASMAEALTEIEVLKQVAVAAKMPSAIEWITDFLDNSEEKLVVFATHRAVIDMLMKQFGKVAVKLDGSVSGPMRQAVVDSFQNEPKKRLFVGNIKAAGVGITLTAASNVAFLELPWTPGELSQAEDRCHRIGQKDTVNVYYLLAEETIEERIAQLLDRKRQVLDSVLDGAQTDDKSLLMELIENY